MIVFKQTGKENMTATVVQILVCSMVMIFLAISYLWNKPLTDFGRISLRLCAVNAIGWLIILPMSKEGHPPTFLIPFVLFWVLNLLLLPAAATVLWQCRKEGGEKSSYLIGAAAYVLINMALLFILPVLVLIYAQIAKALEAQY